MKYLLLLVSLWGGYHYYQSNAEGEATELRIAAAAEQPIVLYGTRSCGYCKVTRKILNESKVAFLDIDVEKSEEGAKQFRELGGNGVPLLLINGKRMNGFNEKNLRKAIAGVQRGI
jgi:mycoredoxin